MSKYETRAKELVSTLFEGEDCTWEEDSIESDFLKLMLQLAEEVEYSTNVEWIKSMKNSNIYTKERVEELLQKQRELCAKVAVCGFDIYTIVDGEEHFAPVYKKTIYDDDYKYNNFDSMPSISVDEDSILNAKLKIE